MSGRRWRATWPAGAWQRRPKPTLLVSGAQHGLTTTAMALLEPGDVVAADALTYPGFKLAAETNRLELAPIPAAGHGPDLDALADLCKRRRVRAVYAMPTLHNPLGWVMSATRRRDLVAIARRHGLMLIEDAAYAFLAEARRPRWQRLPRRRRSMCRACRRASRRVCAWASFAAPREWIAKLERAIRATTWNTPATMTAIACGWLEDGTVARLEEEKRRDATLRQGLAAEILGGLKRISHPSSYFVWLPLAQEVRADAIAMALIRERISVSTALPFSTSAHVPHAIRLALGSVDLATLKRSLETVARSWPIRPTDRQSATAQSGSHCARLPSCTSMYQATAARYRSMQ